MAQVGNKNIDNASGQVVRLDIQNTLAAVASNNFGAKASAGEVQPAEFVADSSTTPKKLLIRSTSGNSAAASATFFEVGNLDEANLGLLLKSGGTMTGQLLADDASGASSPALSFDGDTDTGMFRSGANIIGFSTSGTTRVSISDAGLDMTNALPIRFQDSSGAPFVALKAPTSVSNNVTFTLPGADGTNGQMLQTNGSGALSFTTVNGVPTGSVFCIAVATVPSGYLECNGAAVSRTTYSVLFAVIGTAYGTGDGSSTFNLPDLRGEFVRGFDNGRGVDNGRSVASSQSSANLSHGHSVSASVSDPGHQHATSVDGVRLFTVPGPHHVPYGGAGGYPGTDWSMSNANTGISVNISQNNAGGSEARPRNVSMMYVIKI